jgi:hypothetical protein
MLGESGKGRRNLPIDAPFQDSQKNHEDIISTYRDHLLNAAQVSVVEIRGR